MAQEIADSKLIDTWGSGGTKIEPDISKIIEGWQLGEQPPHEYMNWLQNTFGSKLNHILKNGIVKWNNETEYLAGASVQHSGNVWICQGTNTNSEPAELNANWEKVAINKDLTVAIDTLADLRSISYPAYTVWASGYHAKNDGAFGSHIFRQKGVKTTETDNGGTVIIATVGGTDYVYELQYDGAVNVKWFGAKGDGVTDDTVAIQKAIDSISSGSILIPNGVFLLDTITYIDPTHIYATRGQSIFGFLFLKSNISIIGESRESILKVANEQLIKNFTYSADIHSGVYPNYSMPGTKGFQVFVQSPDNPSIENITIKNITFDLNGYNNKMYPINGFGNQSICQAIYIKQGNIISIENNLFKDCPGHQVVCIDPNCSTVVIKNNTFTDNGLLDGTNINLTDHSTLYTMGTNVIIDGNKFTQSTQWIGINGGAPIEIHNSAIVTNNIIDKYSACGVVAALVMDGNFKISNNIYTNLSILGFDLYNQSGHTLNCNIENNSVEILRLNIPESSAAYTARNFIVSVNYAYSPGNSNIKIIGNNIKMTGAVLWNDAVVANYNSFIHNQLISSLVVSGNIIEGFRGGIFDLSIQKSTSGITFSDNQIISCGKSNTVENYNALINYRNNNQNDDGTRLYVFKSSNNNFTECVYSSYFSFNQVAEYLLAPINIDINSDTHSKWISTTQTNSGTDIADSSNYNWNINYSVTSSLFTAEEKLKSLPSSPTNLSKAQYGIITLIAEGMTRSFTKVKNIHSWICIAYRYGDTAPILNEISPFSYSYNGDTKLVINPSAGGNQGWICTEDGSPGTWKAFGAIQS